MNRKHGFLVVVALATIGLAGCASGGTSGGDTSGSAPQATTGSSGSPSPSGSADLATAPTPLGTIVVDSAGMTAYFFDKDTAGSGTSACTGACLANWPPVTASSSTPTADGVTGKLGTITTPAGKLQITLEGLPLYTYAGDKAAGDVNGQGVNKIWWVSTPSGQKVTKAAASAGTGY